MIDRCPLCPGTHRCVQPDGPEVCDILFIGERPGQEENKLGRPFIGKAGREFNENYLWLAGLDREDIRITNTVLCGADGNRKPTEKEIRECAGHHIPDELNRCMPSLVVLMGGTACSLIPDINLDIEHGIPRMGRLFGWEGMVVPMYHPAAGLHDTGKMIPLLEDFERLGKVLAGEWAAPADPYPNPDYRLIRTWEDWDAFDRGTEPALIAIDTERHGSSAFSVQFSIRPGTGGMLLWSDHILSVLTDQDVWGAFSGWVYRLQRLWGTKVVLHHAPQDLDWLDRMGIKVTRFRDTMQEAYHLGNLPQGLKALAYRLFGVQMRTYEDVVLPHSRSAMCDWLGDAMAYASSNLFYTTTKQLKTKIKTIEKQGEIGRGLLRIYTHTMKSPDYNPWDKVRELFARTDISADEAAFVESTRANATAQAVINKMIGHPGPHPIVGIGNVPLEEAVRYGCADADMTLRVALELGRRRRDIVGEGGEWEIAEGDEDK